MATENKTESIIIIGSGPAGLTAAVYCARAGLQPLVIEGKEPGGQLMGTSYVENWPGTRSILGPKLMMDMRSHAADFGTRFSDHEIVSVDLQKRPFTLVTTRDLQLRCKALIVATGANPRRLGCPGESHYWGKGVTTCAVCDGAFYKDRSVVIVGGGDTAMENASFMLNFTDRITLVHILPHLTASKAMQDRVITNPKIKIIYNSTVTRIEGDTKHVTGVTITNQKTGASESLAADAVFVAIGLTPNTAIFKGQLELDSYGYIKLHDFTSTSVKGVFAAGDVADNRYRQAITSSGTGCMAALDAEKYLKVSSAD